MTKLLTKLQAMKPESIIETYGYRADLLLNAAIGAEENPEHFSMEDWILSDAQTFYIPESTELTCGTTLCIAGWVVHQNLPKNLKFVDIRNSAVDILGSRVSRLDYLFSNEDVMSIITAGNVVEMVTLFIEQGQLEFRNQVIELIKEGDSWQQESQEQH